MAKRAIQSAENSDETQENGANATEQRQKRLISIADSDEQVLKYNQMKELDLDWDPKAFKKLKQGTVEQLTMENLRRYILAEAEAKKIAARAVKVVNPFNPLVGNAEAREYIRARKGWHQAWKNDGREYSEAILGPYRPVREPTAQQKKDGYEVGEEDGEIIKRKDAEGKVEAIAVECRQELFEQYLQFMSDESSARLGAVKDGYVQAIEDINKGITRRAARITAMEYSPPGEDSEEMVERY